MLVSKNAVSGKSIITGLLVCGLLTGCGGFVTDEEATEIRSLLEDLEIVQDNLPTPNNGGDEVVDVPDVETPDPVVDTGGDNPVEEEPTEVVDTDPVVDDEVVDQPAGTSTLSFTWTPSNYFEDGGAMSSSEIAHYEVVYGTSAEALTQSSEVSLGNLLTFEIEADQGSTWYAAVKTVSVYGSESELSNVIALNF